MDRRKLRIRGGGNPSRRSEIGRKGDDFDETACVVGVGKRGLEKFVVWVMNGVLWRPLCEMDGAMIL